MIKIRIILFLFAGLCFYACKPQSNSGDNLTRPNGGKLFIIGGGDIGDSLTKSLIKISGTDTGGYVCILPMASEEPDTAVFYATRRFKNAGIKNIIAYNFSKDIKPTQTQLDSLKNARLIFITGGDQTKFMNVVAGSPVYTAIHESFKNGNTIAGTSAGAAVMSKKMITGNQQKQKEYTGEYKTIESGNIIIGSGLGLLENAIIDQHFVKRMRMNRLISVVIENPDESCIGIDESTAIFVQQNRVVVFGESQVIAMQNTNKPKKVKNGLLGNADIDLDIYLPGDTFYLPVVKK